MPKEPRPHFIKERIQSQEGGVTRDLIRQFEQGENDWDALQIAPTDVQLRVGHLLIVAGKEHLLVNHLHKFNAQVHSEIAQELVEAGHTHLVAARIPADTQEEIPIVRRVAYPREGDFDSTEDIGTFSHFTPPLVPQVAMQLIDNGFAKVVVEGIEAFPDLNKVSLLTKLTEKGELGTVAEHLGKFKDIPEDYATQLTISGYGESVLSSSDSFSSINYPTLVESLFQNQQAAVVAKYYSRIPDLEPSATATRIIVSGAMREFGEQLYQFSNLNSEVAIVYIESGGDPYTLINNLTSFGNINQDVGVTLLSAGHFDQVNQHRSKFETPGTSDSVAYAWSKFFDDSLPLAVRKSREFAACFDAHGNLQVDEKSLEARIQYGVSPQVFAFVKQRHVEIDNISKTDALELIAQELTQFIQESGGTQIATYYQRAVATFGPAAILRYLDRPDLSFHDGLYFWDDVEKQYNTSGLSSGRFAETLAQVSRDGAAYAEGTAHHHFSTILQGLNVGSSVEKTFSEARRFNNVTQLQALIAEFNRAEGIFASWKQLRKYYEITQLLDRSEILEELNSGDLTPRLRTYIETLAFHPNIAMDKVLLFWRNPAEFLDIDDEHTDQRIQAEKKPANYLSLPYLGLTAENLRDALIEGTMDTLQLLPAMERIYTVGIMDRDNPHTPQGLHRYLREALGSRKAGIKGKAQNVEKIFHGVKQFCMANSLDLIALLDETKGAQVLASLAEDIREQLHAIIFAEKIGMKAPEFKGETYRVKIGLKSDPAMVVAGNDTASCMPFGSGKNNVYMFNPNCAQLVVERRVGNDGWRTAAQSVVTIDLSTTQSTADLIKQYQMEGAHLKDLLSDEDITGELVVTCDNIEVAKNEEGQRVQYIQEVYTRFFTEYLQLHTKALQVDATRVAVGKGYTPEQLGLEAVDNRLIPLAPMGYSDNVHAQAYHLPTGLVREEHPVLSGVQPLSVRDVIPVTILEGKAFHDNRSVLQNLHGMQNAIIGMHIGNAVFGRPNLSFMYRDANGRPQGYVLAYEGRNGDQKEIYISDLAADPESRLAGGRLIQTFFDTYIKSYGTAEKPYLPIFMEARQKTSSPIVQRQLPRLAEKSGLVAELEIVGQEERGAELFDHIRVYIGKTPKDISTQKAQFAH